MYKIPILLTLSFSVFSSVCAHTSSKLDTTRIEHLTGAKGELDGKSGIFKITVPRNELKVNAVGVKLIPALGLTTEVSFQPLGSDVDVIGHIVLVEDQVNIVMQTALDNGFNITFLQNYYLWDTPRVMVMGIEGKGALQNLATSVGKVFETIKKTSKGTIWSLSHSTLDTANSTIEPKTIDAILETKGTLKDGVYKIVWDKTNQIGRDTWATFSGTNKQAVLLGNFAIKEDEANNVLKILLKHNIFITSLHQNRVGEDSKIVLIHYMGRGRLIDLTKVLKEALGCIQPKSKDNSSR